MKRKLNYLSLWRTGNFSRFPLKNKFSWQKITDPYHGLAESCIIWLLPVSVILPRWLTMLPLYWAPLSSSNKPKALHIQFFCLKYLPVLFFCVCAVLCFTFRSRTHFELIFVILSYPHRDNAFCPQKHFSWPHLKLNVLTPLVSVSGPYWLSP